MPDDYWGAKVAEKKYGLGYADPARIDVASSAGKTISSSEGA